MNKDLFEKNLNNIASKIEWLSNDMFIITYKDNQCLNVKKIKGGT